MVKKNDKRKCKWCGKVFTKKHHLEVYCSDKCRKFALEEQSRISSIKWYHKHKHELSEKQRWGLGSNARLGKHSNTDFKKEENLIAREFKRLRLKRGFDYRGKDIYE